MAPEIPLDRQRPAEYVLSAHVAEVMAKLDRREEAVQSPGRTH